MREKEQINVVAKLIFVPILDVFIPPVGCDYVHISAYFL